MRADLGLLELPGPSGGWLWAFTCPAAACACRTALLLTTQDDRETLLERGRPVADTWLRGGDYGRIVGARAKSNVSRNEVCSCGSGKKFKKCCGAVRP
jgi:hypothetical protein